MTLPEVLLWQALRRRQLAQFRFRRQHPVGPYILDFYCAAARLAVEVDGSGHDLIAQANHDERRDIWLAQHGVTVLRIAAADILRDNGLDDVMRTIEGAIVAPSGSPGSGPGSPPPPQSGGGSGLER